MAARALPLRHLQRGSWNRAGKIKRFAFSDVQAGSQDELGRAGRPIRDPDLLERRAQHGDLFFRPPEEHLSLRGMPRAGIW